MVAFALCSTVAISMARPQTSGGKKRLSIQITFETDGSLNSSLATGTGTAFSTGNVANPLIATPVVGSPLAASPVLGSRAPLAGSRPTLGNRVPVAGPIGGTPLIGTFPGFQGNSSCVIHRNRSAKVIHHINWCGCTVTELLNHGKFFSYCSWQWKRFWRWNWHCWSRWRFGVWCCNFVRSKWRSWNCIRPGQRFWSVLFITF